MGPSTEPDRLAFTYGGLDEHARRRDQGLVAACGED